MKTHTFALLLESFWQQLWRQAAGLSLTIWGFVGAFIMAVLGLLWDGGWHASWGRDTFFIPPHNMLYTAVAMTLVMSYTVLVAGSLRGYARGAWRIRRLQATPGIWTIFLGCLMLIGAAPFDELYHRIYGPDDALGLWSPPHFAGMLGGLLVCLGILLLLRREQARPAQASGRPRGLGNLTANDQAALLMLGFLVFIVGALTVNFWGIRHWYRTEGTLYPLLIMTTGPGLAVFAQRVAGRAGAGTVAVALPFAWIGVVGVILRLAGYPIVTSLPMMGLPSAIILDSFYARFGKSYRWLAVAGLLAALAFYPSEYAWAAFLNGGQAWNWAQALPFVPAGAAIGTASALLGAWLGERFAMAV
jgi:hypothetical protein